MRPYCRNNSNYTFREICCAPPKHDDDDCDCQKQKDCECNCPHCNCPKHCSPPCCSRPPKKPECKCRPPQKPKCKNNLNECPYICMPIQNCRDLLLVSLIGCFRCENNFDLNNDKLNYTNFDDYE